MNKHGFLITKIIYSLKNAQSVSLMRLIQRNTHTLTYVTNKQLTVNEPLIPPHHFFPIKRSTELI